MTGLEAEVEFFPQVFLSDTRTWESGLAEDFAVGGDDPLPQLPALRFQQVGEVPVQFSDMVDQGSNGAFLLPHLFLYDRELLGFFRQGGGHFFKSGCRFLLGLNLGEALLKALLFHYR